MRLLVTGTSSSGKTSVVNEFSKYYKKIFVDDYGEQAYVKTYSKLKNSFYSQDEIERAHYLETRKIMAKKAKLYKNFIIDDLDIVVLNYLPKDTKKILLYTSLKQLTKNIIKRRKIDPRGKFVYEQFAENFKVTKNKEEALDEINIEDFIKNLDKVKWNFSSEIELKTFAKEIFNIMGIKDSKSHYITSRFPYYDIIINTEKKTPKEIKDEIIFYLKQ